MYLWVIYRNVLKVTQLKTRAANKIQRRIIANEITSYIRLNDSETKTKRQPISSRSLSLSLFSVNILALLSMYNFVHLYEYIIHFRRTFFLNTKKNLYYFLLFLAFLCSLLSRKINQRKKYKLTEWRIHPACCLSRWFNDQICTIQLQSALLIRWLTLM